MQVLDVSEAILCPSSLGPLLGPEPEGLCVNSAGVLTIRAGVVGVRLTLRVAGRLRDRAGAQRVRRQVDPARHRPAARPRVGSLARLREPGPEVVRPADLIANKQHDDGG
jgi:hypothetical protein